MKAYKFPKTSLPELNAIGMFIKKHGWDVGTWTPGRTNYKFAPIHNGKEVVDHYKNVEIFNDGMLKIKETYHGSILFSCHLGDPEFFDKFERLLNVLHTYNRGHIWKYKYD